MEHKERTEHVRYVGQGPGRFLGDTRNDVKQDFEAGNQYQVYCPGT